MIIRGRWPLRIALCALTLGAFSAGAHAQTRAQCERAYTPQRAQEGKDVIWAPTEDSMVVRMLEMAKVTAADKVYDLGAGDGKIVIAAAKEFGATGVGVEYDADLVKHARCLAAAEGVDDRVTFVQGDIFETDFSDATVVALYLTPSVNVRLQPRLLALKPGTRIVSYSFGIGDWQPDQEIDSFGDGSAFFFVVPAQVAGAWTFRSARGDTFSAVLEQSYQHLRGTMRGAPVTGTLAGNELELALTENGKQVRVAGAVNAARITATVSSDGATTEYVGTRD